MSVEAVSALERGFRRSPQGSTVALLIAALGLDQADARRLENAVESRAWRAPKSTEATPQSLVRTNLPYAINELIGREADLTTIASFARNNRIVTIVGPGGIGKTRVAIEVARRSFDDYDDGVFLVDLAALGTDGTIGKAIADAIGVPTIGGDETGSIVEGIGHRHILVLLDNCEHVASNVAEIARTLGASCPRLTMLITSRQPIEVTGESVYRLSTLANDAAVALFEERARSADATFVTDAPGRLKIANLCEKLDGLPLAIELVAARVATLAIDDLLKRVDRPLRLIARSGSAGHARQSTMRAMLDWSFALLTAREREFFLGLATFLGGWTFESAHAVAGPDDEDDFVTLELLESLIAKSLVLRESIPGGETRYRMLQTIQAYGLERIADSGSRDRLARRKIVYFRDLLQTIDVMEDLGARHHALNALTADSENIRSTFDDAVRLAPNDAIAMMGATEFLTTHAGMIREVSLWTDALIPLLDESDPTACAAFWRRAVTAYAYLGSTYVTKRDAAIARSVAYARASENSASLGASLCQNIIASNEHGTFDLTKALLDEAIALGALPNRIALTLLQVRAEYELARNQPARAKDILRTIARSSRQNHTHGQEVTALECLVEIAVRENDLDSAIAIAREVQIENLSLDSKYATMALAGVPNLMSIAGDRRAAYESALRIIKSFEGYYLQKYSVIRVVALSFAYVGLYEKAAILEGFARTTELASDKLLAPESSALTGKTLLALLREHLDDERLHRAFSEGERLDYGHANALAASLTEAEIERL